MDLTGNVSTLVLKRVVNSDVGEVSLDSLMLNALMIVDGIKTFEEISTELNIDSQTLKEVVMRLDKLNLIEPDILTIPRLDESFFEYLSKNLAVAIGPMAEILIEDEIQIMGIEQNQIPAYRGAELVDLLAREIPREEKKISFQQKMLKILKTM